MQKQIIGIHRLKITRKPRLYEETLSRVEELRPYPTYPGRAIFSFFSLSVFSLALNHVLNQGFL